jgi:7-cyano-7-deazaguanine synthase
MTTRAFVLLSGGLDSTTALYQAIKDGHSEIEAVSINYGQRHKKEIDFARSTAARLDIPHTYIRIADILSGGTLTDPSAPIPKMSYSDLVGVSPTYVPFRNGTMIAIVTAHAQRWFDSYGKEHGEDSERSATIYFGAHAEDAHNWAYPDCTPEFIGAMANAVYVGTYHGVRLVAPLMHDTKADIVRRGAALGVPFENTWSCYVGGQYHCGECPTCRARKEAFAVAGVPDPTTYGPDDQPVKPTGRVVNLSVG